MGFGSLFWALVVLAFVAESRHDEEPGEMSFDDLVGFAALHYAPAALTRDRGSLRRII